MKGNRLNSKRLKQVLPKSERFLIVMSPVTGDLGSNMTLFCFKYKK